MNSTVSAIACFATASCQFTRAEFDVASCAQALPHFAYRQVSKSRLAAQVVTCFWAISSLLQPSVQTIGCAKHKHSSDSSLQLLRQFDQDTLQISCQTKLHAVSCYCMSNALASFRLTMALGPSRHAFGPSCLQLA